MKYTFNIEVTDEEIDRLVKRIEEEFNKIDEKVLANEMKVKTVKLAEASKDSKWKYYLDYYPDEKRFTLVVNMSEKQPRKYAVLKLSSVVTSIESPEKFIERVAKLYLLFQKLREKLDMESKDTIL